MGAEQSSDRGQHSTETANFDFRGTMKRQKKHPKGLYYTSITKDRGRLGHKIRFEEGLDVVNKMNESPSNKEDSVLYSLGLI